ncbi:M20/M25/M40 family metallo-hydrolase [Maribius pontilimi]|uniref:M20/M25/M40 family metallo-hydrolase n=1 Tax=Palleronia pontilimi TaxID=1964209 RepID=A0A934ID65_9RHOB|nr:M20/M25/M40 family metallo-hydrolase [Palleronia pontilimi]MBJ3763476.1 M20/M25/M40 family metallo-hydrolase [Palleronia pontilimi]
MSLDAVLSKLDADLDQAVTRLQEFLRIPSISTDPAYKSDVADAARWLVQDLSSIGVTATAHQTPGHPMVVGHGGDSGRSLLFYGHYDVQPIDPLELWDRDPFDPVVEDGPNGKVIRGRGTADDKGQLMTFVEACRAWKAVHGTLPARQTFLFEGEEESGSPSLVPFLEQNRDLLSADLGLICDTGLYDPQTPAITTMLRGLLGEEVTIEGPSKDLHSGAFGGPAMNPIRVLAKVLAGLHDAQGRVTVPGFYDDVEEISDEVARQWDALDFDAESFLGAVGLSHPAGEADRSALQQIWARPTCEVNGIKGGYAGAGFKTVLPSRASAKISFRLVAAQDPLKIREAFRAMVRDAMPPDCTVSFHDHGAAPASRMDISDPAFEAARQALSAEWPKPAAYVGAGGSIPVAGHMQKILGIDSMLIGFGRSDDQIHSPNEKYDMDSFHRGMRSWARILAAIA